MVLTLGLETNVSPSQELRDRSRPSPLDSRLSLYPHAQMESEVLRDLNVSQVN